MDIKKEFLNWVNKHLHVPELGVEIGFLPNATYDDGTFVAKVAYDNNYGNGVPERPFFTKIVEGSKDYQQVFEDFLKQGFPVDQALNMVGLDMQQDIQEAIIDLHAPPNSPVTIARKGSSNPLVDTGHMGDSVTYNVHGVHE